MAFKGHRKAKGKVINDYVGWIFLNVIVKYLLSNLKNRTPAKAFYEAYGRDI